MSPHRIRAPRRRPRLAHVGERLEPRTLLAAFPAAYGRLPLAFEANRGQTDPSVNFLARGEGYALFLTPNEAVVKLQDGATGSDVIRLQLVGAEPAPPASGRDPLPGTSNYLVGADPNRWRTGIANYAGVEYRGVYPGIDLVYHGNQGQLEYDFDVAPGADPGAIRLRVEGASSLALDPQGNLVLHAAGGDLVQHAPVVYQDVGGVRRPVAGRFVLEGGDQVGFALGAYDKRLPLVIDPTLSYSTFLDGTAFENSGAIAVDRNGNAYVVGNTTSPDFPTTPGALQTTLKSSGNLSDAFVAKLNADGTALVYSTYLGGSQSDGASGIAVDSDGDAYVTGGSTSKDFPTTTGAFQTTLYGLAAAFVAKLNASGTALVYSTYLGGTNENEFDGASAIAVDGSGSAYVTGVAGSGFPTTPDAFQTHIGDPLHPDAYVTKLNPGGTGLVYSTFLGGSSSDGGSSIALDGTGDAFVTGFTISPDFPTTPGSFQGTLRGRQSAFVTELKANGQSLVYSTYLGGTTSDAGVAVAVDGEGAAYVAGSAFSADFPTTPGAFQTSRRGSENAFITKVNPGGGSLGYSTYLGGSGASGETGGGDRAYGLALDRTGAVVVTGVADSADFPTTAEAQQATLRGPENAFVTKLGATGSALIYSTYLGGSGVDQGRAVALDPSGSIYVTGETDSADFPTTPGALQTSLHAQSGVFVAKLAFTTAGNNPPTLTPIPDQTVNEGSTLAVHVVASDPDAGQALRFSLDPGAPPGAAIDPISGAFTYRPADGPTKATVTVRVTDNGSPPLSATATFTINVLNVAPSVSLGAPAGVLARHPLARVGSFADPGADTWTATVDYGDGSGAHPLALRPDKTFALAHTYAAPGAFTVTVRVTDKDGGVGTGTLAVHVSAHSVPGDYDGDGKSDLAVYRPSTGQWTILESTAGPQVIRFGAPRIDVPVAADYDGDGKTDLAVYRTVTGQWLIAQSTAGPRVVRFGTPGLDVPVPADYDGDGKADLAVYRPSTGQWMIALSTGGVRVIPFGTPNVDVPVPADYTGDGKADLAVYRPATGQWMILRPKAPTLVVSFGLPNLTTPVPADYGGDGAADVAFYLPDFSAIDPFLPSVAEWEISRPSSAPRTVDLGLPGIDIPAPADYDGDGAADVAVYRKTTGQWLILLSHNNSLQVTRLGTANLDVPVPAR
jgi:hypothetical protein